MPSLAGPCFSIPVLIIVLLARLLHAQTSALLPPAFDYRREGWVTPAKDQKNCGANWAFAPVAQYESLLLRYENKETDLSEQFVLTCTSRQNTCQGGFPNSALELIK